MRDFLKKNLSLLSKELILLIKNTSNDNQYALSNSKSGVPTLLLNLPNGVQKFLHSKYDPLHEASQFIDANYSNKKIIYILIGLGLGYHLKVLYKKISANDRIIIFEKNPNIVRLALSQSDFTDILSNPNVSLHIGVKPNKIEEILHKNRTNLAIYGYSSINLNSLVEVELNYYKLIASEIEQAYKKFKIDIDTQAAFSKEFYKNIFTNGKNIIDSPGIISLRNISPNTPAILVSAGPSLDKNISLIKTARNKIIVITVATALKPLLRNNIEPDFVISIDPNEDTIQSFDTKIIPKNLWLIYNPCIPHSISSLFNSRKIVMESKIALAKWITDNSEKKGELDNVSSVAHAAFQIARQMGCKPIILVGQDLSFEGKRMHCTDSFYNQANQDNIGTDRTLEALEDKKYRGYTPSLTKTLNIYGQGASTTKAMDIYKNQFKKEFDKNQTILNATEGGVNIPGALNISLKEALNQYCLNNKDVSMNEYIKEIKKPLKSQNILISIKKQLSKLNKIEKNIKAIKIKYLAESDQTTNKKKFILEMKSLYNYLLLDESTISLIQGYDFITFVEWNKKTQIMNKTKHKQLDNEDTEKKFERDKKFIKMLSKTIGCLSEGFRYMENQLS